MAQRDERGMTTVPRVGEPTVYSPRSSVLSLAVSADGLLTSDGADGQIKHWPRDGVGEPVVLRHGSWVWSLAVLADGRLASGGDDGQIKVWPRDAVGEPVSLQHGSPVRSLALLPDGRLVTAGGFLRPKSPQEERADKALAPRRYWRARGPLARHDTACGLELPNSKIGLDGRSLPKKTHYQ